MTIKCKEVLKKTCSYPFLPSEKKDIGYEELDPRDGTEEGDRILGEAAIKIRKECELISEEEFYQIVDM